MIETEGLGCLLQQEDGYGIQYETGKYRGILYQHSCYSSLEILEGRLSRIEQTQLESASHEGKVQIWAEPESGRLLLRLDLVKEEGTEENTEVLPEKIISENRAEWENFFSRTPQGGEPDEFLALCWYNLWASVIRASGCLRYDAVLMSKKRMSALWSWDHCFNALALSLVDKNMGYGQFLLPFEEQQSNGCIPDFMKPDQPLRWACTKPPIHGWCFEKMMDLHEFSKEELREIEEHLRKWTEYWFKYRDFDKDGIPEYPMGMDCGWDNCSAFDRGWFVETPDLPAYLILQMQCLERIHSLLGNGAESEIWGTRRKKLMERFLKHSCEGRHFVSRKSGSHETEEKPTCLIDTMPIVLGKELGEELLEACVEDLQKRFETEYGYATEMVDSPKYESDGYWRGPIWAPVTYLLIDGMRRGGMERAAAKAAEKFCRTVKYGAGGPYENFDARTGKGLRAPGYTWTTSVYILLVQEYNLKI